MASGSLVRGSSCICCLPLLLMVADDSIMEPAALLACIHPPVLPLL
jgi:hypothetical protein